VLIQHKVRVPEAAADGVWERAAGGRRPTETCSIRDDPDPVSATLPRETRWMQFSPHVHPVLVLELWRLDDGRVPIAELWRAVSRFAWKVGLSSPGYHTVRTVVRAERERRAAQREALLIALEESFQWMPSLFRITDHLAAAWDLRSRPP